MDSFQKQKKQDGSVFNGWSLNGVPQKDTDKIQGNATLTPNWLPAPVEDYLIQFILADDESVEECPEGQMYVAPGTTYGQLPKAKKTDGSQFLGWSLKGIVQKDEQVIPSSVDLTPTWNPVPVETCKVTFNGGKHCEGLCVIEFDVPINTPVSDFDPEWFPFGWKIKEGWVFDHWDWHGVEVVTGPTTVNAMFNPYNPSQYFTIHSDQYCYVSFINTETLEQKPDLWYSLNSSAEGWTQYNFNQESITLAPDDVLYLKGNNPSGFCSNGQIHFTVKKIDEKSQDPSIALGGSVKGLIVGDEAKELTLPWHALSGFCYNNDFITSVSDTLFSDVSIGSASVGCLSQMFYDCDGLTKLPENLLPSTSTAESCSSSMFENCSNLEEVPTLPASGNLKQDCYKKMFAGDSKLWTLHQEINYNNHPEDAVYFFTAPSEQADINYSCSNMFGSESIKIGSKWYYAKHVPICLHINYNSRSDDEYLYQTSTTRYAYSAHLQYKIEDGIWTDWKINQIIPISKIKNQNVYIRNLSDNLSTQWNQISIGFHADSSVGSQSYAELSGNILSLMNNQDFVTTNHCFDGLFRCSEPSKTIAGYPMLPSKNLGEYCYQSMFQNDSNNWPSFLKHYGVPELPATNLATNCYDHMFAGSDVTNELNSKKYLPASQLPFSCYQSMFENCSILKQALPFVSYVEPDPDSTPEITILEYDTASNQCKNMYKNCGFLAIPAAINWNITSYPSKSEAFYNMYENCTSLKVRNVEGKSDNALWFLSYFHISPTDPDPYLNIFKGIPGAPTLYHGSYYYFEPPK